MKALEITSLEHPFLKNLSSDQLDLMADSAMPVEFATGQMIFREGDLANRFYLIQSGKVALETARKEAATKLIQIIGAGDVLGWSWLFPPYYWHFDARAIEPTKAIFFYGTRLREKCEEDHDLGYQLMKLVAGIAINRLQATRQQLLGLHRLNS